MDPINWNVTKIISYTIIRKTSYINIIPSGSTDQHLCNVKPTIQYGGPGTCQQQLYSQRVHHQTGQKPLCLVREDTGGSYWDIGA